MSTERRARQRPSRARRWSPHGKTCSRTHFATIWFNTPHRTIVVFFNILIMRRTVCKVSRHVPETKTIRDMQGRVSFARATCIITGDNSRGHDMLARNYLFHATISVGTIAAARPNMNTTTTALTLYQMLITLLAMPHNTPSIRPSTPPSPPPIPPARAPPLCPDPPLVLSPFSSSSESTTLYLSRTAPPAEVLPTVLVAPLASRGCFAILLLLSTL